MIQKNTKLKGSECTYMDQLKLENENMAFKQKAIELKQQLDRTLAELTTATGRIATMSAEIARYKNDLMHAAASLAEEKARYLRQIDKHAADKVAEILKPHAPIVIMTTAVAERNASSYLSDFKITEPDDAAAKKALAIARAANPAIAGTHLYNDVPVWYRRIIAAELAKDVETRRRINEVFGSDELNTCYRKLRNL